MAKERKYFDKVTYTGTNGKAKAELDTVRAHLAASGKLKLLDQGTLSQEALINASWLWMGQILRRKGVEVLEKSLRPAFVRLNKIVAEEMDARQKDQAKTGKQDVTLLPRGVRRKKDGSEGSPSARPAHRKPDKGSVE